MKHLSPAVALVLAVSAGTLSTPAVAADAADWAQSTATAETGAETIAPLAIPVDSVLLSAGQTGMLSRTGTGASAVHRWTRLADGPGEAPRARPPPRHRPGAMGRDVRWRRGGGATSRAGDLDDLPAVPLPDTEALRRQGALDTQPAGVARGRRIPGPGSVRKPEPQEGPVQK
ncbi:hypothetical protein GCM10017562_75810 [Streptomyces roseofulvus]